MAETELSLEELAEKDGKEGKPVYIAYEGSIYDVSGSKLWKTGTHMRRHAAGRDLSVDIGAAPHGPEVLERFPRVGVVKRAPSSEKEGVTFLEPLFAKFPILRRHPHPMTVHFPIVFMLSAPFFTLLYLVTGRPSFDTTAFYCLAAGLFFTPIVMLTGFATWLVNYLGRPLRPVNIKIAFSILMLAVSLAAFIWRETVPGVLTNLQGAGYLYPVLLFSLAPLVAVIGWNGAKLTFPVEK
ncbi:MAG: DUF2231 domain-containing protein [Syntrophobacteraceae bacterium]